MAAKAKSKAKTKQPGPAKTKAKMKPKATAARSTPKTKAKTKTKTPTKATAKAKATPTTKVTAVPPGFSTVTPHLTIRGCADAIEFYKKAFGAKEHGRMAGPDGKVLHSTLQIGDAMLMVNDEFPEWGGVSPSMLNGTPVTIHLYVKDADHVFGRAVGAGAQVVRPMEDAFWGDRYGVVDDPHGHRWSIATRIEIVRESDMMKRMEDAMTPQETVTA